MGKVSRESAAQVDDHGPVEDRHEDVDGYTDPVRVVPPGRRRHAAHEGSSGRRVPLPALGLRVKGRVTYRFADHDEVFEAGDAFYLPPGHIPLADAGSESSSSARARSCTWSPRR